MRYKQKEIRLMTTEELATASVEVQQMYNDAIERRDNPKFIAKFKGRDIPEINPAFTQLKTEIETEITNRQG